MATRYASGLHRRDFLAGFVTAAAALASASPARAQARAVSDRLCIADDPYVRKLGPAQVQANLDQFRRIGFGCLRGTLGRIGVDPGQHRAVQDQRLNLFRQAIQSGFRLKLQAGTWSGVPDEFERQHPDAKIVNEHGESPPPGYLSPWFPGLQAYLAQETQVFFDDLKANGLLAAVATVIVDLGPEGESIYPTTYAGGKKGSPHDATFWFYDAHAQAAFGPAMQRRYKDDLRAANQRWGTGFASWAAVRIPPARSHPGALWEDVLIWYRDSKRAVMDFQVETCRAMVTRYYRGAAPPQLVLFVPGTHMAPGAIQRAAATGDGDFPIKLMIDSEYVLDLAKRNGCAAQHTAAQDEGEIRYLRGYIDSHGGGVPLWGENAGGRPASDPGHLADVVLREGLYGLDYVNAGSVLQPDYVTPNETMPKLAEACGRMLQRLPTRPGR